MRTYFAYIRVSTIKQGEHGSSLSEQKDAIERYAVKNNIHIGEWYEEQVTAAKRGRPVFRRMLNRLKQGKAHGLVIHKVDRSARNLTDWAELAALMDLGADIHFAHEGLDLTSRGGRLSADIQAVVASDFIRNLRDEVKKGLRGRLKAGFYPFKAPPGYLNNGAGTLKTIDPIQGPLIREAFELYANGTYVLKALCAHMKERGLLNAVGKPFYVSGFGRILANPFYYGLLVVKGQSYLGKHQPIVSKELFDRARAKAAGRLTSATRVWNKFEYRYRRLLTCAGCNGTLIAENQRGRIYYRCHASSCKGTCVREEVIDCAALDSLSYLSFSPVVEASLREAFNMAIADMSAHQAELEKGFALQFAQMTARENKLTDAMIDSLITQEDYQQRKTALHNERIVLEEKQHSSRNNRQTSDRTLKFIEHSKALQNMAQMENSHVFRELMKSSVSNILICQKSVTFEWSKAVLMLLDLGGFSLGVRERRAIRPCIHSVTDNDFPMCKQCITERDEAYKKAIFEKRFEWYQAVVTDNSLDYWTPPEVEEEASGMAFATRFAQQKPRKIVKERTRVKAARKRAIQGDRP